MVVLASKTSHQGTETLVELTPIPSGLTTMFWVIDEVSLSDVENGYFVHPASLVAEHFREYGVVQIDGEEPAMVFASDGGGHLFALAGSGRVWKSTTASWSGQFDLAATSLQEFLGPVLAIIR
ncbi:hypothetical protein LRE75_36000 [Streptomyces sp. 372A]